MNAFAVGHMSDDAPHNFIWLEDAETLGLQGMNVRRYNVLHVTITRVCVRVKDSKECLLSRRPKKQKPGNTDNLLVCVFSRGERRNVIDYQVFNVYLLLSRTVETRGALSPYRENVLCFT